MGMRVTTNKAGLRRPCRIVSSENQPCFLAGSAFAGAAGAAAVVAGGVGCQPQVWPSFCCFSHSCSGAKYSSTALASIFSVPVSSFSVACHGWLAPFSSIAQKRWPATLLP